MVSGIKVCELFDRGFTQGIVLIMMPGKVEGNTRTLSTNKPASAATVDGRGARNRDASTRTRRRRKALRSWGRGQGVT